MKALPRQASVVLRVCMSVGLETGLGIGPGSEFKAGSGFCSGSRQDIGSELGLELKT